MSTPAADDDVRRAVLRDGIKGRDEEIARMKDEGIPQAALTQALREIRRLEVALVAGQARAELAEADAARLLNEAVDEVWADVLRAVQRAWPEPQSYGDCPTELIARVIDERDDSIARAERAEADAATLRKALALAHAVLSPTPRPRDVGECWTGGACHSRRRAHVRRTVMTDIAHTHIDLLLHEVREIWVQHPSLRLIQLLLNVLRGESADYYLEDAELVTRLRDRYSVEAPEEQG